MENTIIEQRSPEWFEQRKGRITASAVGAIMGLAPYQNRDDVIRRMVREYYDFPQEFCGNAATEYGTFHEAGAISEFEMETGLKVNPAQFVECGEYYGASPDGVVTTLFEDFLLEVKCPYSLRNGGEFKSIDEQQHYYAQIQMQMMCTRTSRCYFYQWSPYGTKTEIVHFDMDFCEKMINICDDFYNEYLIEREFPNADKYLNDKTKQVFDESNLNDLMNEYLELKTKKNEIENKQKELLASMVALTDDKGGTIAGHTLYKTEKDGAISYAKAIKELLPDADLEPYRGKSTTYWSVK